MNKKLPSKCFNWARFVDDVEVMLDTSKKVSHFIYYEIRIKPYRHGTLLVGAYKCSKESMKDRELIVIFENSGIIIMTILKAIEYGLSSSDKDTFKSFNAPYYYKDMQVLKAAFEKGRALRKSI